MAEPADLILRMLRAMRAEMAAMRGENSQGFSLVDKRLTALEAAQVSFRQALGADSLLSKVVTGEFEAVERRVRELEGQN